jgi:MFS family permease
MQAGQTARSDPVRPFGCYDCDRTFATNGGRSIFAGFGMSTLGEEVVLVEDEVTVKHTADERDAMDRLRDRTDELELIISGLTIFALFSVPGWLLDKIADIYTHLSTSLAISATAGTTLLAGTSYGLAACFVVHLMARAYWVGLIGLRSVFPDGINWSKTPGLGPLSRKYYRDTLPDLDTVIQRTDRLASSLFAVISMLTLSVLWFGTILVLTLVLSGAIGTRFGLTNAGMGIGAVMLLAIFLGAPILVYFMDAQLASRVTRLRDSRIFAGLVRFLRRLAGFAYPQRLVLPVRLTLQTNTRPVAFFVALTLGIIVIVAVGSTRTAAWRSFTVSREFTYLDAEQIQAGFRSTYYEDMSSPLDRLRGFPRVDSFNQSGSFVRLFLPYYPLRDNLVLKQLCGDVDEPPDRIACLRMLWTVNIEGTPVPLAGFEPAERADLGMLGLIGLVPLTGLDPGLRRIEVMWNPSVSEEAAPLDDRYTQVNNRYVILIAFSPNFEMSLD